MHLLLYAIERFIPDAALPWFQQVAFLFCKILQQAVPVPVIADAPSPLSGPKPCCGPPAGVRKAPRMDGLARAFTVHR